MSKTASIKSYLPKASQDDIELLKEVIQKRTEELCATHFVNQIEQPETYEELYNYQLESILKLVKKYPKVLKISKEKLIAGNPWDLCEEMWHEPLERYKNKLLIEKTHTRKDIDSDEKCPNCKKKGTSYCFNLEQRRSADEPMTQLWLCDKSLGGCNHRWNI